MTQDREIREANPQSRAGFFGLPSLIVLLLCVIATHLSLLCVPYFWDETYFAPAARDLFLTGKLIPVSVPPESHPPLVYLWIAIWWKLFGFRILVARSAMLAVSAITLAAVYRLARLFTTGAVPIVVTALTAIYPVFFVESTLVQLDMAAAGLTLWGLVACLQGRRWETAVFFTLAVVHLSFGQENEARMAMLRSLELMRQMKESGGSSSPLDAQVEEANAFMKELGAAEKNQLN